MSITNRLKITISPIRLHSASSLQIPRSTARFNSQLPTVNVSPLKLHAVSSINLHGASKYNIFSNHLRIRLSPIKSPILLKYKNPSSVIQLDAPSDWRPGGRGFNPRRGRQHSFVEIDHEIFSTVILSLPLIQEGQLSVSGERMCTILVNRLED